MASTKSRAIALSIVVSGDEPPSEFRIFTAGKVETTKGTFLFDEVAAVSVLAEYEAHGAELMVDYDHASLASISLDPAQSGKAAGWFGLEVRAGELWAVNVRWTEHAASALRAKEWRYMSPAFSTDQEGRVTSLLNVALTNLPATRQLEPLMAASSKEKTMLGSDAVKKALEAIKNGDAEAAMALLEEMIASAAGGEPDAPEAAGDKPEEMAAPPAPPAEDKPEEVAAALSTIARLSGKTSLAASVSDIETWRKSHLELETERAKLAQERATLEGAERRKLCAELVTKAGKAPAEVWANDKADAPKKYLAAMPIEDFREFVADAIKANGKPAPKEEWVVAIGAGGGGGSSAGAGRDVVTKAGVTVRLSQRELDMCDELKIDPVEYAATKPKKVA